MFTLSKTTLHRQSFSVGERVQLHPATDRWLQGDRYGEVTRIGRKLIHVKLDKSGQVRKFHPFNVMHMS